MAALIQFSRIFLNTRQHTPRLDRFYKIMLLLCAASVVLLLIDQKVITGYTLKIIGFSVLLFPFISAWIWYSGEQRARFIPSPGSSPPSSSPSPWHAG
nr:7TM diverse intracellular signaling domain-containing protein [Candidatus Reidiella endopervernicosa]